MHLAIYDEWTKRKKTERSVVAAINAYGEPGNHEWWADIRWNSKQQNGEAKIDIYALNQLMQKLHSWENSMRNIGLLSQGTHLLLFCPFQLQTPVKTAFGRHAARNSEISTNPSVHFPTCLMDAYDGLPYA